MGVADHASNEPRKDNQGWNDFIFCFDFICYTWIDIQFDNDSIEIMVK